MGLGPKNLSRSCYNFQCDPQGSAKNFSTEVQLLNLSESFSTDTGKDIGARRPASQKDTRADAWAPRNVLLWKCSRVELMTSA